LPHAGRRIAPACALSSDFEFVNRPAGRVAATFPVTPISRSARSLAPDVFCDPQLEPQHSRALEYSEVVFSDRLATKTRHRRRTSCAVTLPVLIDVSGEGKSDRSSMSGNATRAAQPTQTTRASAPEARAKRLRTAGKPAIVRCHDANEAFAVKIPEKYWR
jgi:hypothetical protein